MDGRDRSGYRVELADRRYWQRQIRCQDACPVHTDARAYVRAIAAGEDEQAYWIARGPNPLASICGRICGAPCEANCRRGEVDRPVSIRALKRFVSSRYGPEGRAGHGHAAAGEAFRRGLLDRRPAGANVAAEDLAALLEALAASRFPKLNQPPVAIVGSGPAGLACAHDLALMGARPTVFEVEPVPGGMLAVGVPEYRLPRDLIRAEIGVIEALGVEFRCQVRVGQDIGFDRLWREYAAVVIAVGAKRARALAIPGAAGPGVLGGVDFLREVALARPVELGRRVVVIGGGNVAYDTARTVLRQSSEDVSRTALRQRVEEVHLVCLESLEEMPADDVEIIEGDEEGLHRHNGWGPTAVVRDDRGRVAGVRFKRCLRVFDAARRFAPQFDESVTMEIPCDTVLVSVGQSPDFSFVDAKRDGIALNERGLVGCDRQTLATSRPGVFLAGDCATGPGLMIHAIASGKQAARSVYTYLSGRPIEARALEFHFPIEPYRREPGYEAIPRQSPGTTAPARRVADPRAVVELDFDEATARREASRCLDCGVNTIFDGDKCVLCGGCVEVCPTLCLKLVPADRLAGDSPGLAEAMAAVFGTEANLAQQSAIIKDENRCIRCGNCAARCPAGAITMERFYFRESLWAMEADRT